MKRPLFLSLLVASLLMACTEASDTENISVSDSSAAVVTTPVPEHSIDALLAMFQPAGDSIMVSTLTDNPESEDFEFDGAPIPGDLAVFFDGMQAYGTFDNATDMYATFSIEMGERYTALLVRVPGEHWSSRVNIFVYDKQESRLTDHKLEVAESYGDEGFEIIRESVVTKVAEGEALLIAMDEHLCDVLEADADPVCTDSVKTWVFTDADGFEQLSSAPR